MKGEAYYLVFLFGLADALTTEIGLKLGFVETRLLFAPFLATFLFFVAMLFFDWKKFEVPETWREVFKAVLVLVALSPVISNLQLMLTAWIG